MMSLTTWQNRELQIMRNLEHRNVVDLKYYFYSAGTKACTVHCQVSRLIRSCRRTRCTSI